MSSSVLKIQTPEVFLPLLQPSRYKGARGGRGSGKSHFFAELGVERCLMRSGSRGVCIREVQKTLKESAKRLIEDKIAALDVGDQFNILNNEIGTPGGGVILFQGMQDHTAESIKSLEGFDWAWVEEAQTLSARSLEMLRPTIRAAGSEIWASWNPRNAKDAIDEFLCGESPPKDARVVRVNYSDNPFFPKELELERQHDQATNAVRYGHIWLGEYEPMAVGAIWERDNFRRNRRDAPPALRRVLVGVDPAVSSEPGADEHGIVCAGIGEDQRGYVLADATLRGLPREWAQRVLAIHDLYEADAIVVEINQGGDMVKHTLQSIRPNVRIIEVRATKGKHVRAEPISALYSADRISHVGTFTELENQMCQMTAAGYEGEGSPDRVDALVWAMTELFPSIIRRVERKVHVERNVVEGGWLGG